MRDNPTFWLILRVTFIALGAGSAVGVSMQVQMGTWTAAWLLPPAVGAITYFYFNLIGWRQEVDLSEPLALTKPFWPPTVYPTRFWALCACASLIGGCIVVVRKIGAGETVTPMPVTSVAIGIAIYAAIWVTGLTIDKSYR